MKNYFRGWYFKLQSETYSIAFIPSYNIDESGCRAANIQVVTPDFADCAVYDYSEFRLAKGKNMPRVFLGGSEFSENGSRPQISTGSHSVRGVLDFGELKKPRYDIMGPFCAIPFMECRHSVVSLRHEVSGSVYVDGKFYDFSNSTGYIEGDRGRSFPKKYLWTQCLEGDVSLMLSVADIPMAGFSFTGVIGAILAGGREYRLATYLGAKVNYLHGGKVVISQGAYTFTAEFPLKNARPLYAPVNGDMVRLIRENISCPARYKLEKGKKVLLDFESSRAGFEYEYPK